MKNEIRVLKIGGNQLDDAAFLAGLATWISELDRPPVIVHGGGRAIADLQARYGLEVVKVEGLRVTDPLTMKVVEMALSGQANKRIVAALTDAGVDALGLSGVDRGLLRGRLRVHPEAYLGRVGQITEVRDSVLRDLLEAGIVPVVSPVSLAPDGAACNVNADEAATAIALALNATSLDFVSDVPGVQDPSGAILDGLSALDAEDIIAAEVVYGGMVNKVRAALEAVAAGLPQARILDLNGLAEGGGTRILGESSEPSESSESSESSEADTARRSESRSRSDIGLASDLEHEKASGTEIRSASPSTESPGDRPAPAAPELDPAALIEAESRHLIQVYQRQPIVLTRGEGAWLWDAEGRRYLDFGSGIAVTALGHSDPGWVAAVTEQAGRLTHVSNLYHSPPMVALAERLTRLSFADRVFFCNSGTEAIEAAIKIARKHGRQLAAEGGPPRRRLLAFEGGFHGRTAGALSLTAKPAYRQPFEPLVPLVAHLPYGDLDAARAAIDETVCAVFVEPLQGEGGIRPAPEGFLAGLRQACDEAGALLVFDEVQCGLGRTGQLWAHEPSGVTPDLMCLAKPLAGGLPIGALLATEAAGSILTPGDHGSTFAGGPLVCAAACEVLDRIADPEFLTGVRQAGAHLRGQLQALADPRIVEVRGQGLLVGIELTEPVAPVIAAARERGLLLLSAGERVLRLAPPLIVSPAEIEKAVEILAAGLAETR